MDDKVGAEGGRGVAVGAAVGNGVAVGRGVTVGAVVGCGVSVGRGVAVSCGAATVAVGCGVAPDTDVRAQVTIRSPRPQDSALGE